MQPVSNSFKQNKHMDFGNLITLYKTCLSDEWEIGRRDSSLELIWVMKAGVTRMEPDVNGNDALLNTVVSNSIPGGPQLCRV